MGMSVFTVLQERTTEAGGLPPVLEAGYGGALGFPEPPRHRPYVITSFITSLDGVVSFNDCLGRQGSRISGGSPGDRWLLGLLRGVADAVLVGAGTLREETAHVWTTRALRDAPADEVERWRRETGRPLHPHQCIVTGRGILPESAALFQRPDLSPLILTTREGKDSGAFPQIPGLSVFAWTDHNGGVDLPAALEFLRREMGVRLLLCEGGPKLYLSLLEAGCVDECFQTIAPCVIGSGTDDAPRRTLGDGRAWGAEEAPRFRLQSVRAGVRDPDLLFLRYRRS